MIRPIGQNIVIEKDPAKPTSEGGILIPECAERTPRFAPTVRATVVGVGGRVKTLERGDRVAVKVYAGDDYFYGGRMVTFLREKDVVGVIK